MKVITYACLDMETMTWISEESYDYEGPVALACGPGHSEVGLSNEESTLAGIMDEDFQSRFAGQTQTLGQLSDILQNLQSGKELPGMSAEQLSDLNSAAIDTTAGNYKNAQIALNDQNASRGGNSGLQPGTVGQENETLASNEAGQLSSEEQQIQLANAAMGQQNTATAIGGYNALAGLQSPTQLGNLANQSEGQAFGQADRISGIYNSDEQMLAGGITSLAAPFLSGFMPSTTSMTNPTGALTPNQLGINTSEIAPSQTLEENQ